MHIREDEDGFSDVAFNITPMVDVVFLLLIFFMVATSFLEPEKEIEVELPRAESGESVEIEADELVINVMRDGRVTLGGVEVDDPSLRASLDRAARLDPTTPVTIRGDRQAEHQDIVRVMDACGTAGLSNLAVGTLDGRAAGGGG